MFWVFVFGASFIDRLICIFLDTKMPIWSWDSSSGKPWLVNIRKFDIIIVPTSRKLDFSVSFHYGWFCFSWEKCECICFSFSPVVSWNWVASGHTRLTCLDMLLLGFLYLIFKYLYNNTQVFLTSYKTCMAEWSCINVLQCDNIGRSDQ